MNDYIFEFKGRKVRIRENSIAWNICTLFGVLSIFLSFVLPYIAIVIFYD